MAKKAELLSANYTEVQQVAAADYSAGDVVTLVDVTGFTLIDVLTGETFTLFAKAEKVRVEKNAGEAWATGDSIYWDATAENFTTTLTANTLVGVVYEVAASADVEGVIVWDGYAAFLKV